jgi:hypothetical protein
VPAWLATDPGWEAGKSVGIHKAGIVPARCESAAERQLTLPTGDGAGSEAREAPLAAAIRANNAVPTQDLPWAQPSPRAPAEHAVASSSCRCS